MRQRGTPRRVEAVSKYFVAQAVASAFLLLGVVLRFFFTGKIDLFSEYKTLSYVFILRGLFIKIAVIPNPFWFIDTVRGLKLIQGFYVVITSKLVPIYLFITLLSINIKIFLMAVGLFSIAVGSFLGLKQTNVRKIIALSSIAHLGWLVVGLPYLDTFECLFVFICYLLMVIPLL